MPKHMNTTSDPNLTSILEDFAERIRAYAKQQAYGELRAALDSSAADAGITGASNGHARRGRPPGRPPLALASMSPIAVAYTPMRRKAPMQLCPVPRCKNPAAPIFGMVCKKHKDLPKAQIAKFRAERKAKKEGKPVVKAPARTARKATKTGAPLPVST